MTQELTEATIEKMEKVKEAFKISQKELLETRNLRLYNTDLDLALTYFKSKSREEIDTRLSSETDLRFRAVLRAALGLSTWA
ncbi:hypothetical protein [Helicobacter sp. 11S02629-2]|uniref:hypothetical protein n=1 Tax=Helicobacter sp. 11S02629-2 TaxID=1476195 RepID=UPI000BA64AD5|nr:hypothetical protein [Helicobacter sp. 11S02629-2]PAF44152.1 hypothetical protein BKH40_06030 [Helicobacter sp. 11S02629-2]